MKYFYTNTCPARKIDMSDRKFYCFITGYRCDYERKTLCQEYNQHMPKLERAKNTSQLEDNLK